MMRARGRLLRPFVIVWALLLAVSVLADAPLTLEQAKQLAVKQNVSKKILAENLHLAGIAIQRAWGLMMPTITASASITRNENEVAFPSDAQLAGLDAACAAGNTAACQERAATQQVVIQELWSKTAGIQATMPLFSAEAIPLIISAYTSEDATGQQVEHATSELLYGVTSAYIAIVQAEKMVAIANQGIERAKEHVKLSTARQKAGQAIRVDVLRAEMELTDAEKQALEAAQAVSLAKEALALLLNRDAQFSVADPQLEPEPPVKTAAAAVADAYARRLDLAAARKNADIARNVRLSTWLSFVPSISAQGSLSWQSAGGFAGDHTTWQVMFMAVLPIFESGQRIADLRDQTSQLHIAELQIEQLKAQIAREVREAWLHMELASKKREASRKQVTLARENYDLVKRQYEIGLIDNLTMLDAGTALLLAEQTLAGEELAYILSVLTLRQKAGYYIEVPS